MDDRLLKTIDVTQIVTNVLAYYIEHYNEDLPIGPWTSLGLEYFITEYYDKLPPRELWVGFPLLQQKKLWTREGIDLALQGEGSLGYQEWFEEFQRLVESLGSTHAYWRQWQEILNYYLAKN
jgi:hypothetical protein